MLTLAEILSKNMAPSILNIAKTLGFGNIKMLCPFKEDISNLAVEESDDDTLGFKKYRDDVLYLTYSISDELKEKNKDTVNDNAQLVFLLKMKIQNLLNCEVELINENDVRRYYFKNIIDRCVDLNDFGKIETLLKNKAEEINFKLLNKQSAEYVRSMWLVEQIKSEQASSTIKTEEGINNHRVTNSSSSALFTNIKQNMSEGKSQVLVREEKVNFVASSLEDLDENSLRAVFSKISPNACNKVFQVIESLKRDDNYTAISSR